MTTIVDSAIGAFEVTLAAVLLRHIWRFKRGSPWIVVLAIFFIVRGVDRMGLAWTGHEPQTLSIALDGLLLLVLMLLLLTIERVARSLALAESEARRREYEYSRALRDYRRLVRHRLATPLTTIFGSVRFLQELSPDQQELRAELLEMLEQEAVRLNSICLDPDDELRADERGLEPRPQLWPSPPCLPASHLPQAATRPGH